MPEMNRSFPQSSGTYESAAAQQERMRQYFAPLPPYIQEGIHQSGVNLRTEAELRQFAENLMGYSAH